MANVHSKLCEYQRSYFFFDGRHNTEKAQEEIAHIFYGANTNVVQPMTIRELIVYPAKENMLEFWEPNNLSTRRRRSSRDNLDLSAYYWNIIVLNLSLCMWAYEYGILAVMLGNYVRAVE